MKQDKLAEFLRSLPLAHGLCRACECVAVSRYRLQPPALDLGCGDGIFAMICFGRKKIKVGLDIDASEIKKAQLNGAYQKTVLDNITDLPFKTGEFKTVFSNCTLEHVVDIDQALKEAARVLCLGGQLIFTVPAPWLGEYFLIGRFLRKVGLKKLAKKYSLMKNSIWQHHQLHSQRWWERRLKRVGFKQVEGFSFAEPRVTTMADLWGWVALPFWLLKRVGLPISFPKPKLLARFQLWMTKDLILGETKKGASFIFRSVK